MSDIILDVARLSRAYADGSLVPHKVLEDVYARIAARGTSPVWISLVPKELALAKLSAAPRGALWGIPFAVKDNIDVAGMETTCACPDFAYVAERSATVVERLEAAGAILIGKTNLDQFATGLVGTRTPYGICSSVFDAEYISGGSSSGSAVAVAAGLVSFALGTDTAGSGRVPAGFNNIVGVKPTKGLVSTRGLVPACRSQDVISVFANTVWDGSCVLSVMAAFDAEDSYSRCPSRLVAPEAWQPGLRAGVPEGLEFFGDDAAAELFAQSVERVTALGATVAAIDFKPFREAAALLYSGPWVAERLAALGDFARDKPGSIEPTVRDIILGADKQTAVNAFEGFYKLADLIRAAEAEWAKMDMMLLPTSGTTYKIADVLADPVRLNSNLGAYTNFVNLMDLSALAVPAGFRPNGLPFGVTLIGRAFDDGHLAMFGDALHRAMPDASSGAARTGLTEDSRLVSAQSANLIQIAVVGAHLTGQPLNSQLADRGAKLVRSARTAKGYSFYALAGTVPAKPGLVYDGAGAGGIEVEIWEMDAAGFGSFVALIPPPLGIGTLALDDGSAVKGFICETHGVAGARDITSFGGWRAWLAAQQK